MDNQATLTEPTAIDATPNGADIPVEVKRAIVGQELQMYCNTRYQLQLRYRVQKAIGGEATQLEPIENELVKIERAIDLLDEELKALK